MERSIVENHKNKHRLFNKIPKNIDEAIRTSYGASKTIVNVREKTNANFKKRAERQK